MKHTKKRILSIFLIAMMLCSLIPAPAFAMQIQHNISAINSYRNLSNNNSLVTKNLEKLSSGYRINRAGDNAAGLAISEAMRAQINEIDAQLYWIAAERSKTSEVTGTIVQLIEKEYATEGNTEDPFWVLVGEDVPTEMVYMAIAENQTTGEGIMSESILIVQDNTVDGIEPIEDMSNYIGSTSDSGETGYTLSFDVDGGTAIGAIKAAPGHEIDLTDKVQTTKEGHTLAGLYLDAECTQPAPNTIEMTSDITLYVKWTAGTGETIINADGSTTTTTTNANGSTMEITENTDGTMTAAATISATDGTAIIATAQASGAVQIDLAAAGNVTAATVNLPQNVSDAVDANGLDVYINTPTGTVAYQGVDDAAQLTNLKVAGVATASDVHSITLTINDGQPTLTFTDAAGKEIPNVYGGTAVYVKSGDAAGLAISESMKGHITGLNTEQKNAEDSIVLIQTAEGALQDVHDMLNRMNTLVIQAANDTYDPMNYEAMVKEVEALTAEIARIGSAGTFDAEKLLGINISTPKNAEEAVGVINEAINQVSAQRGKLGAMRNRLEYNLNNLSVMNETITAAENRIRDVDIAEEMMAYTKNNILIQSAQAMLAQANQQPQSVLQLLQ